jgi:hypothetical protein
MRRIALLQRYIAGAQLIGLEAGTGEEQHQRGEPPHRSIFTV